METSTEQEFELSKTDVAALRRADSVSFHSNDGTGRIICTRGRARMEPFQQSHTIAVDFEVYGLGHLDRHRAACFEMIMGARHDSQWQTVAKLVRPGDELTLVWRPDWLSNAYSQKATYDGSVGDCPSYHGLHVDTLYLQVVRKHKTAFMFLIDVSVCPDNSARMIRRGE